MRHSLARTRLQLNSKKQKAVTLLTFSKADARNNVPRQTLGTGESEYVSKPPQIACPHLPSLDHGKFCMPGPRARTYRASVLAPRDARAVQQQPLR